jgi:hypothetical protein
MQQGVGAMAGNLEESKMCFFPAGLVECFCLVFILTKQV